MAEPTLEEMGLGWAWIGAAYKSVYEAAQKENNFGAANTALNHLAKMQREEQQQEAAQIAPPPKIDIAAFSSKVEGLIEAAKEAPRQTADAVNNQAPNLARLKAHRAAEANE